MNYKGQDITNNQLSYDLVYRDIIINYAPYDPGQVSSYSVYLNFEFNKIYKAELICGTVHFNGIDIPASVKNSTLLVNIPQLNGNSVNVANEINNSLYVSNKIFCQIPDNYTPLGGGNGAVPTPANSISTFVNNSPYSAVQFYNPPLSNVNVLDISILDIYGNNLLNLKENFVDSFYFTFRIYYFIKRNDTTSFSVPVISNYILQ
uniref:Uncharacterized protein n=1 Tax=viral metagenome TaxID=1070528 RepID=A0A6C0I995_9ZZZZ